jgi:hypothetical protein
VTFAEAAQGWWPLAARALHWPPETFWQATPRELASALADPARGGTGPAPTRAQIAEWMERDDNG